MKGWLEWALDGFLPILWIFLYPPAIVVEDIVIAAVRHTFLFTLVNMDGFE
jgi:hypothetical protein